MKQVDFFFTFDTKDEADIVHSALKPEINDKLPRVNAVLSQSERTLHLSIKSSDISSLRAACNSYLRWVQTITEIMRSI
jgi:tRNA threonylcarbamoyladenosine modification (KEOPS) complex  Pcc1 subunit